MTDESPWSNIVGPCYTTASMARALGWSETEVSQAGDSLRLLKLETDEGVALFPSFQLHDGGVVPGLPEILRVLRTGIDDPWTWAQWLNTQEPEEDPPRYIELLYGGQLNEALRNARHDAWSWRQ